jgi:hypothetical protein
MMAVVGLPVAIAAGLVAHDVFHLALNVWVAAVLCFSACAASTRATALAERGATLRQEKRQATRSQP